MSQYNHTEIEKKWQKYWDENQTFKAEIKPGQKKYYVLDMFPYPSGNGLHVGHAEGYTASDVTARYKRMKGFNVLHPMGWDAFGLPAERYAERTGTPPAVSTKQNCDRYRQQLKALGLSYDWSREISTADPKYYKWTQWIFTVLYNRGLAYESEVAVNWCPKLGTVLANEEVKDGKYVETGDEVIKKPMRQWVLKITAYAERLLQDLDKIDWPESIKTMQREWIGKSIGADVEFKVDGTNDVFTVFTTRPDTLFGATYCVLAPEHPLVGRLASAEQKAQVDAYVAQAAQKSAQDRMKEEKEKTGVFLGAYAVNPVNGKKIPIYISDYVLGDYGYGAIMAVPAHDQRDYDFAKKFNLPIIQVIAGGDISEQAYEGDGALMNSSFLDGLHVADSKAKMIEWLEEHHVGKKTVNYKLRDWLFSRQRYWGEPFPILHTQDGGVKVLPLEELPVLLPDLAEVSPDLNMFKPTADGEPPLAHAKEWVNTKDKETGLPATRELNIMPQWAGSSWYFLRFCDANNDNEAWSKEAEKYWMPVDLYIGGAEHAVLHLLYARFWHKVLYDAGYVSTIEPFQKLFNQGMILAYSYKDANGKYYYPEQVERKGDAWFVKETGTKVFTQIEKMSKSRYNVVNPDDVIRDYGADTMRVYEMFMGPVDKDKPWTSEGINGAYRFLKRLYNFFFEEEGEGLNHRFVEQGGDEAVLKELHKTIKGISFDIENFSFNTCIAKMMEFMNATAKIEKMNKVVAEDFVKLTAPFTPHLAEEVWQALGHKDSIAYEPWPAYDEKYLAKDTVLIPVQVMGKKRAVVEVPLDSDEQTVLAAAKGQSAKLSSDLETFGMAKMIYVKNKILNIVLKK